MVVLHSHAERFLFFLAFSFVFGAVIMLPTSLQNSTHFWLFSPGKYIYKTVTYCTKQNGLSIGIVWCASFICNIYSAPSKFVSILQRTSWHCITFSIDKYVVCMLVSVQQFICKYINTLSCQKWHKLCRKSKLSKMSIALCTMLLLWTHPCIAWSASFLFHNLYISR